MRQVDVLVNNAGASRPMSQPDDDAAWQEALQINFVAARRLAEAFIPSMVERGWGRIINLTGAILGKSFNASASAKAALESWSRAASGTYAAHGITVNCVAPGRLNTAQILQRLHPTEESRRDFIARNIPAGRFGEPEEAAALIAFLASDRASYITGTAIPVDGGTMRWRSDRITASGASSCPSRRSPPPTSPRCGTPACSHSSSSGRATPPVRR